MNCLLNILAVCMFDPSGVYLTAGMDMQISGYDMVNWCRDHRCTGAIGEFKLGVVVPVTREISLDYGLKHVSYVAEAHDRGKESAYVSVTWRPFR